MNDYLRQKQLKLTWRNYLKVSQRLYEILRMVVLKTTVL